MTGSILLYGATGYTGKLIAREARAKGASAVLAGRNPNMLKAVAKGLDLPWRTFDLADQKKNRRRAERCFRRPQRRRPVLRHGAADRRRVS